MLRDAMIFGGGILVGWLSLAGIVWLAIIWDERKRKDEE
jgi:hypothetical protein